MSDDLLLALQSEIAELRRRLSALAHITLGAGEALRGSEARLHALSDTLFEAIFLSERGVCIDQNHTAELLFGYTLEEALGQAGSMWIAPEYSELVMTRLLGGDAAPYEVMARRKDGSTFPCEIQAKTFSFGGRTLRVTALRDISLRHQAEAERRRAEAQNQALLAAIPDMMFIVGADGHFRDYRAQPGARLVAPPEDFMGKTLVDVLGPELGAQAMAVAARARAGGEVQSFTYSLVIQGEICHFETLARGLEAGQVLFLVRDVTESYRNAELSARAERLETASRIASQVAHDFNNLLAPLSGYPALIRQDLAAGHPALPLLAEMEVAAAQMAEINQELLTLGRRGHFNRVPVDINALVRQVAEGFHPAPGVEVRLDLAAALPSVLGGPAQLARALANLGRNALDAVGEAGWVAVRTEYRAGRVRIFVSDSGPGISEAVLPHVFEPFFTTKRTDEARGSGLGLAVVASVVEDHGGEVVVRRAADGGACFILSFPRCDALRSHTEEPAVEGSGARILVVDDEPRSRRVVERLLTRLGYSVAAVASGELAVAQIAPGRFDLVILDMVMPGGMDGVDTWIAARAKDQELRGILLSGYSEHTKVREGLSLGISEFVRKPAEMSVLARAVSRALLAGI